MRKNGQSKTKLLQLKINDVVRLPTTPRTRSLCHQKSNNNNINNNNNEQQRLLFLITTTPPFKNDVVLLIFLLSFSSFWIWIPQMAQSFGQTEINWDKYYALPSSSSFYAFHFCFVLLFSISLLSLKINSGEISPKIDFRFRINCTTIFKYAVSLLRSLLFCFIIR